MVHLACLRLDRFGKGARWDRSGCMHGSRWAKTRKTMCHLFGPKLSKIELSPQKIKIEQLGLRRGLWGHSFKSSYSLELILDFLEKNVFWFVTSFF